MKYIRHLLGLALMIMGSTIYAQYGSIEVRINGIENNDGIILIGLYDKSDKFPDFDESFAGAAPKANKMGTSYTFTEIPSGTYALAVWHDEDEDKTLDKNILGIPRENYGFSNNASGTFGPPDFEDAAFKVVSDKKTELVITLK